MKNAFLLVALAASMAIPASVSMAQGQEKLIASVRFIPPTPWEDGVHKKTSHASPGYSLNAAYADRMVYWNDDPVGQFLVTFINADWKDKKMDLELLDGGGAVVLKTTIGPMTEPKAVLLLAVNTLKPGKYTLRASLPAPAPAAPVQVSFERADKSKPVIPFPAEGLEVRLDPQSVVPTGDWPICTGVPFPQGTIYDLSKLALFEDGKEIPAQIEKVCTWHPEVPGDGIPVSVSWARLSFVGRYLDGKPRKYVLRLMDSHPGPASPSVKAVTEGDVITVDNGVVKFQVNTKNFRGVESAWFEGQKVIDNTGGAYIVDAQGHEYEACNDAKPSVVVEEAGPVRVVIAADGWYTAKGDLTPSKLCLFNTRIIVYPGEPMVRVYQHTVVTFDTDKMQLADVGYRIGVPGAGSWSMGADGKTLHGDIPGNDKSVFMHQYRWNKLRVVAEGAEAAGGDLSDGQKSDGWFTINRAGAAPGSAPESGAAAVTVLVRDFWQKFPKEMEVDAKGFNLHFWPKHGIETFTQTEMTASKDIYKLWWYEQGKLLDLKFPEFAYDELKKLDAAHRWDPESTAEHAREGNAQGVAIGNEFVLRFHKPEAADQRSQAALFQLDPHAISDPNWNVKTLVEGNISAYDPKKFPVLEADLDTFWPDYMRVVIGEGTEYGMWTYADVHDNWEPGPRAADLHRVASASHYRNVSTAWLYYFRGDSPDNLIWAAANTDHFMDIDTVNYASRGQDEHGNPRWEFKWHFPGAMYHAKGFTPWGTDRYGDKYIDDYAGVMGHWVNPDAFRYRYLLEGSGRAWDLYMLWAQTMKTSHIWPGVTRENVNTFGEELSYYTTTWDPDFIQLIHYQGEAMVSMPMEKMPTPNGHPVWHLFWFSRAYDLVRDERVKAAVLQYSKTYGKLFANLMAWDYEQTGDKSYLDIPMPSVHDESRLIYRNPDDPLDGCRMRFAAYGMFYYQQMPYYIEGLNEAGVTQITPGSLGRSSYMSRAAARDFNVPADSSVLVLALKPQDRDFTVTLNDIPGYKCYLPVYRVIAPDGKVVFEQAKPAVVGQSHTGRPPIVIPIPKDGMTGVYRIDCRNNEGMIYYAPYTDLPVEGTLLESGNIYHATGRSETYLMPVGSRTHVQFTWKEGTIPARMVLGYVRVTDARGKVLLETTLLEGFLRSSADLDIDVAKNEAPYHVYQVNSGSFKWTGSVTGVVSADSPESAKALAAALEKGPAPAGGARVAPAAGFTMRIVHYYADGQVRCGIADRAGRIFGLETEPDFSALPARQCLEELLRLPRGPRDGLNDRILARGAAVLENPDRLAPAVPDPPLYFYLHGNAPTVWKRQQGGKSAWEMSRVPHCRIRPWSSLTGHGATFELPAGANLSTGTEFAVVIGAEARSVAARDAWQHIAGIVATNDGFLFNMHGGYETNTPASTNTVHMQAMHTLFKSSDGMGGLGPCLVTIEEVERDYIARVGQGRLGDMRTATGRLACLYDLLTRNYHDDRCVDRSHTSGFLLDAEYVIAYLSRFMTLRTGSIIGLGSAGWDGQYIKPADAPGTRLTQEFEIEDYGRMRLNIVRAGGGAGRRESPLLSTRRAAGLPAVPRVEERSTRAFWMARGNCRDAGTADNVPDGVGLCPFLIPSSALGDAATPIVIPPAAGDVDCAVHLAAVIGDAPAFNVEPGDALRHIAGVAVMLVLHDRSLGDRVPNPTDYEARPTHMMGYYADGFCRLGRVVPASAVSDLGNLAMSVTASDGRMASSASADYRYGLGHMIAMISRTITLLPGDVLSLGRAGKMLRLPGAARLGGAVRLGAQIKGLGEILIPLDDQRDSQAQSDDRDFLFPTR